MFTVSVETPKGQFLYEAKEVSFFENERIVHAGSPAERIQKPSIFILPPASTDGSGTHIYEGAAFVMNEKGKTVARYIVPKLTPTERKKERLAQQGSFTDEE